jgi:hypothetical protein
MVAIDRAALADNAVRHNKAENIATKEHSIWSIGTSLPPQQRTNS